MFHAPVVEADCKGKFGRECNLLDTPWLMPSQPRCRESGWINLDGNETSECFLSDGVSTAACLFLSFDIIPFQALVTKNYTSGKDVEFTVAGYSNALVAAEDEYADYGKIYIERSEVLDARETLFEPIAGGVLIRTDSVR